MCRGNLDWRHYGNAGHTLAAQGAVDNERLILLEYPPVDIDALVSAASLIARARVTPGSRVVTNGERAWTDYPVQIITVTKGAEALEGKTLTVRREGGVFSSQGKTIHASEPDFPPFETGEEYVLFLSAEKPGIYVLPYGAQGAFSLQDGRVRQVSKKFGTWNREHGAIEIASFLDLITARTAR